MKNIIINYDIIDKIHQAKGEYKLKITTKNSLKFVIPFTTISIISGSISCLVNQGIPEKIIPGTIIYNSVMLAIPLLGPKLLNAISNTSEEEHAYATLTLLSRQLKNCNIKTDPTLLIHSFIYKKKYKLALRKKSLPSIIENKQLIIPIEDNNGNIKEVVASQQHKIGTWQYKLSFDSRKKSK